MRLRLRRVLLGLLGTVVLAAVLGETLFYFPLTPLSFDRSASVGLTTVRGEVSIVLVGDTMLGDDAEPVIDSNGWDYPFARTRHLLRGADIAIGNLEGPITRGPLEDPDRTWSYRVSPRAADALRDAGFTAMTLANNHVRDAGDRGVADSAEMLSRSGIRTAGAGATEEQAHAPIVLERRGVRVGLLAYLAPYVVIDGQRLDFEPLAAAKGRAGAALGTPDRVRADVSALRPKVDVLLVVYHLGDRYERELLPEYEAWLDGALDAGADAVVCHGTHIANPMRVRADGKPVLHGIGNFAFGSYNEHATVSLAAALYVDEETLKIVRWEAISLYTNNVDPLVRFQPQLLTGILGRRAAADLVDRSRVEAGRLRAIDGRVVWSEEL